MSRRRVLASGLALGSAVCAFFGLRPESAGATLPAVATPVWSASRLPALVEEAEGTVNLEQSVDALLGEVGDTCFVAYQGDRLMMSRRASEPLTGASTQKLLVAVAAVHRLGPGFRFETKVVAEREPVDGTVGRLWLVGSGDPLLATPEYAAWLADKPFYDDRKPTLFDRLAEGLSASGVQRVSDGIMGDDSRYERLRSIPTWKPNYVTDNEAGPLGALLVNTGYTKFTLPEVRAVDPAVHAAAELSRLAVGRGIVVAGEPRNEQAPDGAVTLASVRSVPLSELVAIMVTESDNTAAELLTREMGKRVFGQGTTAAGTKALREELARMGLPTEGARFGDGSGLEATNTVTCGLLAQALRDNPQARKWLAVAGRSGTLGKRLAGTALEGKVAGKTGSIKGVTGIVGVVDGKRPVSFAFLANGSFTDTAGRVTQDRLAVLLFRYPDPG